jgi:toxin ParE1/3/4
MSLRVQISRQARTDVVEIVRYLSKAAGTRVARNFIVATKDALDLLATVPGMGASRDYPGGEPDMRIWAIPRYRDYLIFYRATVKTLRVIRVIHGYRDLERLFGGDG